MTRTNQKLLVVLNPHSGSVDEATVLEALDGHLADHDVTIHTLSGQEDVRQVVRQHVATGCQAVVGVGGDGTISCVADALVGTSATLLIVPLGTANVLARELNLPLDLKNSLEFVADWLGQANPSTRHIDAMKVKDQHFFTQVGVGVDSLMIRDTKTHHKRRFGRLAYLATASLSLFGFGPRRFRLVVDGRSLHLRTTQVVVANTGMMGQPGLRWGPGIDAEDGTLNVCIAKANTLLHYVHIFWHVVRGQHEQSGRIRYEVARKRVVIAPRHPLPVQADGEILGDTPVTIDVVPAALRVAIRGSLGRSGAVDGVEVERR